MLLSRGISQSDQIFSGSALPFHPPDESKLSNLVITAVAGISIGLRRKSLNSKSSLNCARVCAQDVVWMFSTGT